MKSLIGKMVYIKSKKQSLEWNDEYKNAWGTIIDFDGEYYHIQMYSLGTDTAVNALVFLRGDFSIRRDK